MVKNGLKRVGGENGGVFVSPISAIWTKMIENW